VNADELIAELRKNHFISPEFGSRSSAVGAIAPWVLVLATKRKLVFGLRLLDFPAAAPRLRIWDGAHWSDEKFEFDFTSPGDATDNLTQSKRGIKTLCIPYHEDYRLDEWHSDHPWDPARAEELVLDLVGNILVRI
jgi:hypothetical protein